MDRLLSTQKDGACVCGHPPSSHQPKCIGASRITRDFCYCEEFEELNMPLKQAIPLLVDCAGSCQSDDISLAIMAVLNCFLLPEDEIVKRVREEAVEDFKREVGFKAIVFNGETAMRLLEEEGIYVGDGGELVNTKVERLEKAIRRVLPYFESHQVYDKGSEAILREALQK